jgi:hypothetical protein
MLIDINPRALYMPSACHSLNLSLCDMAKSCGKAITFFGIVQCICLLFYSSTGRWNVLLKHVPSLTVEALSNTRWEIQLKSVTIIRYQSVHIGAPLNELCHASNVEPMYKSDAKKLFDVRGTFEFLISMVIWHYVLFSANMVTQKLQSPAMCIDPTLDLIHNIMEYFESYRNEEFSNCLTIAIDIANDMVVPTPFPVKRHATRKKQTPSRLACS